jgi:hypothetical protein
MSLLISVISDRLILTYLCLTEFTGLKNKVFLTFNIFLISAILGAKGEIILLNVIPTELCRLQ